MKKLSVSQAIVIGKRSVIYPALAILFAYFFIGTRIMEAYEFHPLWFFPSVLGTFVLMWLYWSFAAPRWLAWAYQRVENKADLRKRAVAALILWEEGHFFNKTMIVFPKDKAIIEQAKQEINNSEEDEADIDKNLSIYITPLKFLPIFIFFILLDILAIYVFATSWNPPDWSTLGLCLLGIVVLTAPFFYKVPLIDNKEPMLKMARMYFSKEPLIEVFEKGISIKYARTGLIEWKNVSRYHLIETDLTNVDEFFLVYKNEQQEHLEVEVNFEYTTFDAYTLRSTLDYYLEHSDEIL